MGWRPPVWCSLLSAGGAAGPTRLILAGSATAFALNALTMLLLLLFEQETLGFFAWGNGTLTQTDLAAVTLGPSSADRARDPRVARRLDVLALGDDAAACSACTCAAPGCCASSSRCCSAPPR